MAAKNTLVALIVTLALTSLSPLIFVDLKEVVPRHHCLQGWGRAVKRASR